MTRVDLLALGVPVVVRTGGARADEAARALRAAWSACLTEPADRAAGFPVEIGDPGILHPDAEPGTRFFGSMDELLDATSSGVTRLAIERRSRDLLMLHACGLLAPSGAALACVAASGTGKTMLAIEACGRGFAYLSDETVGIRDDGSIEPYPKPLSVKEPGRSSKLQLSPRSLGLALPGPVPARLARIVLICRDLHGSDAALREIEPVDAILSLVPQLSYLSRLDAPLQRLAGLIEATGDVIEARYTEAEHLIPLLHSLATEAPTTAPALRDEETTSTLARWRAVATGAEPAGEDPAAEHHAAAGVVDVLVRGMRCAVLANAQVFELSPVGAAAIVLCQSPRTLAWLERALVAIFGETEDSAGAVRDAVGTLTAEGLLRPDGRRGP